MNIMSKGLLALSVAAGVLFPASTAASASAGVVKPAPAPAKPGVVIAWSGKGKPPATVVAPFGAPDGEWLRNKKTGLWVWVNPTK
ncbi:hypothetical protein [Nonomuraea salmonea]|uniref:Uncharacterized protein n=1 Tax=Nonomuraea salmonea TaxID=46181 RepID=A0ABV5P325_9ACTN